CEGGTVARGRSSTCSLTTAARLSANRIAAPLGERREAFQAARKNRNLVCAIIRLRTSLRAASLGSHGASRAGAGHLKTDPPCERAAHRGLGFNHLLASRHQV